jgi:hypothetical protein
VGEGTGWNSSHIGGKLEGTIDLTTPSEQYYFMRTSSSTETSASNGTIAGTRIGITTVDMNNATTLNFEGATEISGQTIRLKHVCVSFHPAVLP